MIIIVEGPAAAGKTSFATQLSASSDRVVIVPELIQAELDEPKDLKLFLKNDLLKAQRARELESADPEKLVVVDRGHASALAFAYAEMMNDLAEQYDETLEWYMSQRLQGTLLVPDAYVYITAPKDLIVKRARVGGWYRDDLIWLRDPEAAMRYYEYFFAIIEPNIPVEQLDGARPSAELAADFLAVY